MPSLIHLAPRSFSSLPSHPALDPSPSRPQLHTFIHSALTEAHDFFTTTIPQTFQVDPKLRSSPPASAKVQLSTCSLPAQPGGNRPKNSSNEFWVCRQSFHRDAAEDGTASWDEFRKGLRENHSENEMEYTPSVTAVERLLQWPSVREIDGGWTEVDMHVNMITHTFHPAVLISPRTFISLVISANLPGSTGFMTVQIPLAYKQADSVPNNLREKITSSTSQNTIFAAYASVERVVSLSTDALEWTMATTSDAGGLIPQWIQRNWTMGGVPRAVVADVGLFIGWTKCKRKKNPNNA